MGAPTSAILAETYIRHMEHKRIYIILIKCQIIGSFKQVDDCRRCFHNLQLK
jgi:hypothetical protein